MNHENYTVSTDGDQIFVVCEPFTLCADMNERGSIVGYTLLMNGTTVLALDCYEYDSFNMVNILAHGESMRRAIHWARNRKQEEF